MYKFWYPIGLILLIISSCSAQTKIKSNETDENRNEGINATTKLRKPQGIYTDASIDKAMQDKEGNLWFASNGQGVCRFDGKSFTYFTEEDGLDNNIAHSILQDRNGNIWVGTKTGLNKLNPKIAQQKGKKAFEHVEISINYGSNFNPLNSVNRNPLKENGVWCMMEDKNGTIWFGTDDGVYCLFGNTFTSILDNPYLVNTNKLELKAIFAIHEDKNGNIWFAACTKDGISVYDGKSLTQIVKDEEVRRVNQITEDRKGDLWFAASFNGICQYDGKTFKKNIFRAMSQNQCSVLEDKAGNIWFDKFGGVGCYDGNKIVTYTKKEGLPFDTMVPILNDKDGNIWFAGGSMGLCKYDGRNFINYSYQ